MVSRDVTIKTRDIKSHCYHHHDNDQKSTQGERRGLRTTSVSWLKRGTTVGQYRTGTCIEPSVGGTLVLWSRVDRYQPLSVELHLKEGVGSEIGGSEGYGQIGGYVRERL